MVKKKNRNENKSKRRSSKKLAALDPKYNTMTRQEYMDAHRYMNGVKDKNGNEVIRAMTEEEKEWLNKFYSEYYGANLKRDGSDLHDTEDETVRKDLYHHNNARNRDLYGQVKKTRKLTNLDIDEYDRFVSEKIEGLDTEHLMIHDYDGGEEFLSEVREIKVDERDDD